MGGRGRTGGTDVQIGTACGGARFAVLKRVDKPRYRAPRVYLQNLATGEKFSMSEPDVLAMLRSKQFSLWVRNHMTKYRQISGHVLVQAQLRFDPEHSRQQSASRNSMAYSRSISLADHLKRLPPGAVAV